MPSLWVSPSPKPTPHGNRLLVDVAYFRVVCEGQLPPQQGMPDTQITYPGQGAGRTCAWPELAQVVAASNARPLPGCAPVEVRLVEPQGGQPAVDVQVVV